MAVIRFRMFLPEAFAECPSPKMLNPLSLL